MEPCRLQYSIITQTISNRYTTDITTNCQSRVRSPSRYLGGLTSIGHLAAHVTGRDVPAFGVTTLLWVPFCAIETEDLLDRSQEANTAKSWGASQWCWPANPDGEYLPPAHTTSSGLISSFCSDFVRIQSAHSARCKRWLGGP